MRFFLDAQEEWLPADWLLHVVHIGDQEVIEIERAGRRMTLTEALTLRDLETTSSKPHNRVTVFPGSRK